MLKTIKLILLDWDRYLKLHKKMNPILFLVVFLKNPGMLFSLLYRIEFSLVNSTFIIWKLIGFLLYPLYFVITYYILDIDISPRVRIGKNLYVHNRGIVIADGVIAGNNLTLVGPITFGVKGIRTDYLSVPILKDNVTVYTGARIIGKVHIGNNVIIGANAVVIKDITSNCIVGGVPARVIKKVNV